LSRLDSFIRRLTAQRDCLDAAAARVADLSGPVLELGLGNGRTYSHLVERLPGRDVFVFEREVMAHPRSLPPPDRLILGDFLETLPTAGARIGAPAVLAHMDVGNGDEAASRWLAAAAARLLVPLLANGAVVVGDQPLDLPDLAPLPLPETVEPGRYFMFAKTG